MRLLFLALALACAALGILFGALNAQPVAVDFYAYSLSGSLGAALLVAAFLGALLGGLAVMIGVAWPLRRRLRRIQRQQGRSPEPPRHSPTEEGTFAPLTLGTDRP